MRPSTLRLTPEQEKELTLFIKRRLQELEKDNRERIEADRKSDLVYRLQRSSRAVPGTLFDQSNFPVPLTSWVVDHFSARTEDELLSRDPCARFRPQGTADDDVARGIDRLAAYKFFDQGTVKTDLQKSVYAMFAHRALLLKAVYSEQFNEWEEYDLEVLHDKATGQPVQILGHGFIIKDVDTFTPVVDMLSGEPEMRLDADPTFKLDPAQHYYQPAAAPIRFKEKLFAAPRSVQVDSDRFFAPSDARSLDDADFIAEFYDKDVSWVLERFTERESITLQDYLAKLKSETAEKKTKGRRSELSTENLRFDMRTKRVGVVECWITIDILGWGRPQRIVTWYDKKRDLCISYDFANKITPQGKQPYTAIPIWQQDDVWWGYSIPEMLEPIQDYIDLQFNRHSHRNAINSNPIVGEHPDAIEGNQTFADLKPFQTVTLAEGKTIRDWIETFTFPNADTDTQELIEKAVYWVNFWLGISNIARGDYSDIPQNTTLGGQEATLREASKLSRRWTRRVIVGLEEHFTKLVRLLLETMDDVEAYTFLEGDVRQFAVLEAARVRDLVIDAKLVWNTDQNSRTVQVNQLTLQIVKEYATYLMTAPWMIPMVRPVMKSSLYMLGHDNVDTLLPLPPMIPPMPIVPAQPLPGAVTTEQPGAQPSAAAPENMVPFADANAPATPGMEAANA
jgi:hypothetical protein